MSRYLRKNDLWPADKFAAHVWHLVAALEDVVDLVEASTRNVEGAEARAVLMKKALVELKSFDEVVGELQQTLRGEEGRQLFDSQRAELEAALAAYHRAVQLSRKLLADVRNTLAGHRHSLPDDRQRRRFGRDFQAWGEWEQHLVDLEQQCSLRRWLNVINAAIALRNEVVEIGPGSWFSIHGDGIRFFLPLRMDDVDREGQ